MKSMNYAKTRIRFPCPWPNTPARRWAAVRDRAILAVLANAGLRVAELTALELADINIGERSGQAVVRRGKGGKLRTTALNREARRALADWLNLRGQMDTPAVFAGGRGERLTTRQVQRIVADLAAAAGGEATPHTLRHTCAKSLLDSGAKLTEVQSLLGHARLDTTARYTTPSLADLQAAVERL